MTSAAKKKVLVFIDWFYPGDKAGGPVRSCVNLIQQLGDEFEFSVVTRDTDYTSAIPYTTVRSNEWNSTSLNARVYYISADQLTRQTIRRLIAETEFDYVYLNGVWSQPFSVWPLEVLKDGGKESKVVLAVRGMLAPSAMSIKPLKKKLFLAYAKMKGIYDGITFHATNEKEATEVRTIFGNKVKVLVAGNLPRRTAVNAESVNTHPPKTKDGLTVINIARIAPEKNTLDAIRMLRHVKSATTVHFWGATYNEAYYSACKEEVKSLPEHVVVHFHGSAESSEIHALLRNADVLFLPTRGENFGHVILESLQVGTPVLISDQTPWKNLEKQSAGWDLPLNNESKFAQCLDAIATMSQDEYQKWVNGAMKVADNYTNDSGLIDANRRLFSY